MNEQEAKEMLKRIAAMDRGKDHIGMTEEVVVIKTPAKKEEEK